MCRFPCLAAVVFSDVASLVCGAGATNRRQVVFHVYVDCVRLPGDSLSGLVLGGLVFVVVLGVFGVLSEL